MQLNTTLLTANIEAQKLPSGLLLALRLNRTLGSTSDAVLVSPTEDMNARKPSSLPIESEVIVQRQLDAYNTRDLDAWLATYSAEAEQFMLHGGLLASGRDAIRSRMQERFADRALHATLLTRVCMENIVIDHEVVTRTFPDGLVQVEMVCLYEVNAGAITKATFAMGQARPVEGAA